MANRLESIWDALRNSMNPEEEQANPIGNSYSQGHGYNYPVPNEWGDSYQTFSNVDTSPMIPVTDKQVVQQPVPQQMSNNITTPFDMASIPNNTTGEEYVAPVEEPGFMSKMGDGISDFWNDEEKMANLAIGLNSMRLNPDANLAKAMQTKIDRLQKNKGLTTGVKWLRSFAMKQTDPAKRQKYLEMAIMAEQNPTMAKDIIEKGMEAAHGIGAADNKPYEPRFDGEGKEYIPVYNPNTNTVDRVYTGTYGMSPKQKITFETEEKLRQTDIGRRDKKVAEVGASIENIGGQINKIDGIIQNLDEGAMSGFVSDVFPTLTTATANLEQLKNYLGLDVIGSVTFGALSESELRLAMATAVPPGLGPKALKEWAISKVSAMRKYRTELYKKAQSLGRAEGYNSWIMSEAKTAQENAKLDFYNLNKNQQSQVTYQEWSKLNNEQRKKSLKIMGGM
jgi:hypothetical protein